MASPKLAPHELRHTAASHAVKSGENLPLVGKLLGYRSLRPRRKPGTSSPRQCLTDLSFSGLQLTEVRHQLPRSLSSCRRK